MSKSKKKFAIIFSAFVFFLSICTLTAWIILPIKVFGLYTTNAVLWDISKCFQVEDERGICFYENTISSELKGIYSQDEFVSFFDENYSSCFIQINFLFPTDGNQFVFNSNSSTSKEFVISDDVCVQDNLELVYEEGSWKINSFLD